MKSLTSKNYVLLSKQCFEPRSPTLYLEPTEHDILQIIKQFSTDKVIAVDWETKGTDAWNPNCYPVGIGIAGCSGCVYVHLGVGINPITRVSLLQWLAQKRLTSFNVQFDASWFVREGYRPDWAMCTYGMFRYLSTEGWFEQRFNLGVAISDILGWPLSNKDEMAEWLKANNLTKADLYLAPPELLGKYCALDAEAHWQLFQYFAGVVKDLPNSELVRKFHKVQFIDSVYLLIEQNLRGMRMDMDRLKLYLDLKTEQKQQALTSILTHPDVAPWIETRKLALLKEKTAKEPKKTKADGELTVAWIKWEATKDALPTDEVFNINSKQQLGELIFKHLGFKPIEYTPSGDGKCDKDMLGTAGDVGQLILKYNKINKELGYITSLYSLSVQGRGTFHASYKSVGTLTGRLGGGKEKE